MTTSNGVKIFNSKINWDKGQGLIPAIIQDENTRAVLMLGYMNRQSLAKTLKTKKVWFYSRSKQRLWMKGETSKNFLYLLDIKLDCDGDVLLLKVRPISSTCHTGDYSCFGENKNVDVLAGLFNTIADRKIKLPKGSYTASLFKAGLDKISLKVAEEALEVIQAAKKQTKQRLTEESADLIYHLFVFLAENNISLEQIKREITRRNKT